MSTSQKFAPVLADRTPYDRSLPVRPVLEGGIGRVLGLQRQPKLETPQQQEVRSKKLKLAVEDQILALYDEYRPRLFRYIRSMNLGQDQVEEVIQETFLRLTTLLLEQHDVENLAGWMVRVAHNIAVDVHKRNGRSVSALIDLTPVFENRIDPLPNPEEAYSRKEQIHRMETALATFSAQQRRCFFLRSEGFRYKDIGQVFGISEQRAAFIVKQVALKLGALCD